MITLFRAVCSDCSSCMKVADIFCLVPALPEISGSRAVSDVAALTRPRYHFVSDAPVYYSRAPYENPDLGAGSHVTRFISLAASGIPNQKSLIALQLVPADEMDPEDRHGLPDDSTRYPYQKTTAKANKRNFEEEVGHLGSVWISTYSCSGVCRLKCVSDEMWGIM